MLMTSDAARNIGAIFDSVLSMEQQFGQVCMGAWHHLQNISRDVMKKAPPKKHAEPLDKSQSLQSFWFQVYSFKTCHRNLMTGSVCWFPDSHFEHDVVMIICSIQPCQELIPVLHLQCIWKRTIDSINVLLLSSHFLIICQN